MSKRIPELQQEVLVLWGRNDEIVDCKFAENFARDLPHSRCDPALWHVNGIKVHATVVLGLSVNSNLQYPSSCMMDSGGVAAG